MTYNPKDRFFHKAKAEGFVARSAYKLDELQKKLKLISRGQTVLDCGAAPGAWSQISSQIVGPQGRVIGLDLKVIELKIENAAFYQMDVFQFDPAILEGRQLDCLLSDMAPNTTGVRSVDQARSAALCEEVLKLTQTHLKTHGNMVMKLFEGSDGEKIAKETTKLFRATKRFKPEAVRKGSFETYIIGLDKKA